MKIRPYLLLLAAVCLLSSPQAWAAGGTWVVDSSGNWSGTSNWDPAAVPGTSAGDVIDLTQTITADINVTIDDVPVTAGILNIDSGTNTFRTILGRTGTNYLLMDNNSSEAKINLGTFSSPQRVNASLITAPIRLTTGGLALTTYGVNVGVSATISSDSAGAKVIRVAQGSGNSYFRGAISDGSGQVAILNDTTETTFFTAANAFTGGITIQHGNVRTTADTGFGSGTITLGTASTGSETIGIVARDTHTFANNIVVSSAATTATAKISTTISSSDITYSGTVDLQRGLTVAVSAGNQTTFSGDISGAGGLSVTNTVSTAGTMILSGANTYSGTTTVGMGSVLLVNGDNSGATGAVTASGNNAFVGGAGTIGGAVTIGNQATLGVGGASPGTLTVGDSATINDGGSFSARINGATAGSGYDQVVINGSSSTFFLTDSNDLKLTLGYTPSVDTLFFLVDMNDSGATLSGIFESLNGVVTDLSQGKLFSLSGQDFLISYTGDQGGNTFTGGNDLVIQAVPEPSAALLLAAGLTVIVTLRRRRA